MYATTLAERLEAQKQVDELREVMKAYRKENKLNPFDETPFDKTYRETEQRSFFNEVSYSRHNRRAPLTPWGRTQDVAIHYEGPEGKIYQVSTSSHGGYRVTGELLKKMPDNLRKLGYRGWFEEDCAWAAVVVGLPGYFTQKWHDEALETLKRWYPEQAAQSMGE